MYKPGRTAGSRRFRHLLAGILLLLLGANVGTAALDVQDLGLPSGFQDSWNNQYRRARSFVTEDFDGDGRVDFFVGNAGDESTVYRNLGPGPDGVVQFTPAQILLQGELAFVASVADYDNDSDLDLFVGCGGLEGLCLDFLFRNDSTPGQIQFTSVGHLAGIQGPAPMGVPLLHATGGGNWGDFDRDGDQDLFVSVRDVDSQAISYKSILWRNNGNGTFTDRTVQAGLDYWSASSGPGGLVDWGYFQNSTWIDVDNDGDLDLFLNNSYGPNVLWKNLLTEQGVAQFEDATQAFSLPGEDLGFPYFSFASSVADFNNDGWQDLILFARGPEHPASPYGEGHGLFINQGGTGFFNASLAAGINRGGGQPETAMGCQAADLNADGIPDLAIGAGDPATGITNQLFLSTGLSGNVPLFADQSALIDFEPSHSIDPLLPPYPEIPPFPYRTHGIAGADFDGDGFLELGMTNGGPAGGLPIVREPNRLFSFSGTGLGNTFRARLIGDGLTDSRDAIGARAYVEIPTSTGTRRVFRTVLGGSGFSAHNELTLTFGLGAETAVSRLAILWPSGCIQILDSPATGSPLVVNQACWSCSRAPGPAAAWLYPDAYGCGPCLSDSDCGDGIFCNGTESCLVSTGQCQPGTPPSCDDGDPCTVDACDPGLDACLNTPPSVPGEVQNLRVEIDSPGSTVSLLTWDGEPSAAAYNVYRAKQRGLADLACFDSAVPVTSTTDTDPIGPGECFYYLVTATNCAGESSAGWKNPGGERSIPLPCP